MTLQDFESRRVTLAEIKIYGAHQNNLSEDRSILSAAKFRPMILVSSTCGYSRGFHQGKGVKYNKSEL